MRSVTQVARRLTAGKEHTLHSLDSRKVAAAILAAWPQPILNSAPNHRPKPGAVLRLVDGSVATMVKPGRQAPPLTVIVRRQAEPEREIPLTDVAEVMWSP
jgi:hypothetical protein